MHAGLIFGFTMAPHSRKEQAKHSRTKHSRAKRRQSTAGKAQEGKAQAKHSRQKLPVPVFPNCSCRRLQEDSLIRCNIPTVCLLPILSPCRSPPFLSFSRIPMLPAQSDLLHTLILKHDLQQDCRPSHSRSTEHNICNVTAEAGQNSGFQKGAAAVPKHAMHCSQPRPACSPLPKQRKACRENEIVGLSLLTHLLD
jgi:hypothetical protein